ncbi:MAG: primosomal replication protein N [Sutterellaceae bacterium]|nr:primosomal replication protein N [Burkholderiaceae bacterium]MCX7900790.1 primosomal replication protein N [Burkholderiaceae bacterium]MDW8429078.1 primosomal replication protein N [Sutterellaceae bacterium]
MNRLALRARLVRHLLARLTPSGLRVQDFGFHFHGTVVEAMSERMLDFEFEARAVGAVAERLAAVPLGATLRMSAFLAPSSRGARRLRIHITDFEVE